MRCNKCKSIMVPIDIVELNGETHHIQVCVKCGNTYSNRPDKFELAHLILKGDRRGYIAC